jgi:hypothetical protein
MRFARRVRGAMNRTLRSAPYALPRYGKRPARRNVVMQDVTPAPREASLIEVPSVMRQQIEEIIKPETRHLAPLKRALKACLKGR